MQNLFWKASPKKRKENFERRCTKRDKFRIYLINVESFATKKIKPIP